MNLTVNWNAVSQREDNSVVTLDHYKIYRSGNSNPPAFFGDTTTGLSFVLSGVIAGATYTFQIAAVSTNGIEGTKSDPVVFTVPVPETTSPPKAPTGVAVVGS